MRNCVHFLILFTSVSSLVAQSPGVDAPANSQASKSQGATPKTPADSLPAVQKGKSNSIQDVIDNHVEGEALSEADLQTVVEKWTSWDDWTKQNDPKVEDLRPSETITNFGPALCAAKANLCLFREGLYAIHIVGAERVDSGTTYKFIVKSSVWYLYRPNQKHSQLKRVSAVDGKFPAIVGSPSGILVSLIVLKNPSCGIHLPKVGEKPDPSHFDCANGVSIKYDVVLSEKSAANVTALTSLVNAVLGVGKSSLSASGPFAVTEFLPPLFVASASVYQLDKKMPRAPFDWTITANINGPGNGNNGDCSNLTSTGKCSYTRTVSIDSPQYWNIGINLTLHGPRENKYALSSSNIVTQSHTIHSPFFAAFDFSPWSQEGWRPYFQAGVPLSGAAFHLPFISLAEPLPFTKKWLQLSVYGSVVFMKQTFPKTLAVGQTSNTAAFNSNLVTDRAIKPIFGIEVPVSSIVSKIKSSVGAGK